MSTTAVIAIVIVAIIVVAVVAWLYSQRRRSAQLRERFGPEYGHAVEQYGKQGNAEAVLEARQERAERFSVHSLTPEDRARLIPEWRSVETRFVDDPAGAVGAADALVSEVMMARGYPEADFEQRLNDISATNPDLANDYRATHNIALSSQRGEASTEDLRKAMVTYKNAFENLLGTPQSERSEVA